MTTNANPSEDESRDPLRGVGGQLPPNEAQDRRPLLWLALGSALGLFAAAYGLLGPAASGDALPDDSVALVNGVPIREANYLRAMEALASDRRGEIGPEERAHVLDRLIDEELLVQRGLELGLARYDRRVRGDLVSSVIESAVTASELLEPDREDLLDFYRENTGFFRRVGRVHVRRVFVRDEPARSSDEAIARAREIAKALRGGEPAADVKQRLGDPVVASIPDQKLPPSKLREYLGPTLALAALELQQGEVSEPVASSGGYHVLQLVARTLDRAPEFDEVEVQVRAEYRRRAGDQALRDYLDRLRDQAQLRIRAELP